MTAQKPRSRRVDGVLLLDKPVGMSSNAALQVVKRLYQARKAGHTGSLDPLASGLLPICLGEATKLSAYLLDADKSYRFTCRLGATTSTGDAEGEVLTRQAVPELSDSRIQGMLADFTGDIEQLPPMYSALKHQGQRLYTLARQGIEVERRPRQVTIRRLVLLSRQGDDLELEVHCSKGTYVRTLAEDIGRALGCGGYVSCLRRIGVAPYDASRMVELETLRQQADTGLAALDRWLLPLDSAIRDWPAVRLHPDAAYYLCSGQPVLVPKAPVEGWVRLYDDGDRFLGVGEILDDGRVAPRRLIRMEPCQ